VSLGVHFAINAEQAKRLLAAAENEDSDDDVMEVVEELEEDDWDDQFVAETDKAWDAIHRCLTDGSLKFEATNAPLSMCIFGAKSLCSSGDYFVEFKSSDQVKFIAKAINAVTREWLKERYWNLPDDYQGEKNADDWEYTWQNFAQLQSFFQKAAAANRAVIFTVDQ
jgi:hypothetical protein